MLSLSYVNLLAKVRREIVDPLKRSLVAGTVVTVAFVAGFLRGYTWGIGYILNSLDMNGTRRREESGVGGVQDQASAADSNLTTPRRPGTVEYRRVLRPFREVPWWAGNVPILRDIRYDIIEAFPHLDVAPDSRSGVDVIIANDALVLHSRGASGRQINLPLDNIAGVSIEPRLAQEWLETHHSSGADKPVDTDISALYREGDTMFWCVEHHEKTIVLELSDHRYARLVTEVDDPPEAVTYIKSALDIEQGNEGYS